MITRTVWCTALLVTASLPALADTPINQVRPLSAEGTVSIDNVRAFLPLLALSYAVASSSHVTARRFISSLSLLLNSAEYSR